MTTDGIVKAAWNREEPENMDFMEQKLYWALRSIYFLFESGDAPREEAAKAKENLIASYEKERKLWVNWMKGQAACKLLSTSTNAEARRIAQEVQQMFET